MFLHVGGSQIVFHNELIGIFKLNLEDSPVNRRFLESSNLSVVNQHLSGQPPKSFVVTDRAVKLSPISPLTLSRR